MIQVVLTIEDRKTLRKSKKIHCHWEKNISSWKTITSLRFSQFEVSCCCTKLLKKSTFLSVWSQLLSYKATQTSLRFSQFEVSCYRTKLLKQVYASVSLKSFVRILYGRYHEMVFHDEIFFSQWQWIFLLRRLVWVALYDSSWLQPEKTVDFLSSFVQQQLTSNWEKRRLVWVALSDSSWL
jgi:hypothetical protein